MTAKRAPAAGLVVLKHHLSALRLPTMNGECEQLARQCASENVDHLGFLLRLCERELAQRQQRACLRRLKAAGFPQLKSLDDFDFTAQPSLNRPLILELARCEFIGRHESVILLGGTGTGKTHVATGLAAAGWTCWCSTNSAMCRRARPVPNCCSTSSALLTRRPA
jgi:DNA replication protein DnaC